MSGAEVVAMAVIIAMSANHVPSMTATIGGIEYRTSEEEIKLRSEECRVGKV